MDEGGSSRKIGALGNAGLIMLCGDLALPLFHVLHPVQPAEVGVEVHTRHNGMAGRMK